MLGTPGTDDDHRRLARTTEQARSHAGPSEKLQPKASRTALPRHPRWAIVDIAQLSRSYSDGMRDLTVPNIRFAMTSALEIAFEESGPSAGPVVVLLHGFPYSARVFDEVVDPLVEAGCRCVVPHLRGFGQTRFLNESTVATTFKTSRRRSNRPLPRLSTPSGTSITSTPSGAGPG